MDTQEQRQTDFREAQISWMGECTGVYTRGRDRCLVKVGDVWLSGGSWIGRVHVGSQMESEYSYPSRKAATKAVRLAGKHLLAGRTRSDLLRAAAERLDA